MSAYSYAETSGTGTAGKALWVEKVLTRISD